MEDLEDVKEELIHFIRNEIENNRIIEDICKYEDPIKGMKYALDRIVDFIQEY